MRLPCSYTFVVSENYGSVYNSEDKASHVILSAQQMWQIRPFRTENRHICIIPNPIVNPAADMTACRVMSWFFKEQAPEPELSKNW